MLFEFAWVLQELYREMAKVYDSDDYTDMELITASLEKNDQAGHFFAQAISHQKSMAEKYGLKLAYDDQVRQAQGSIFKQKQCLESLLDQAVEQINMDNQLMERGLHRSEKFKVGGELSVECGFYPSEELLLDSCVEQLRKIYLVKIEYRRAYMIARLTFVFSASPRPPPAYSYDDEPT